MLTRIVDSAMRCYTVYKLCWLIDWLVGIDLIHRSSMALCITELVVYYFLLLLLLLLLRFINYFILLLNSTLYYCVLFYCLYLCYCSLLYYHEWTYGHIRVSRQWECLLLVPERFFVRKLSHFQLFFSVHLMWLLMFWASRFSTTRVLVDVDCEK